MSLPEQDVECGRQVRPGGPDRQCHPAEHREPDHAQGRLQGQRHPVDRLRHRGLPCAAPPAQRSTSRGRRSPRSSAGTGIGIEWTWQPPLEFPFEGNLVEARNQGRTAGGGPRTAPPSPVHALRRHRPNKAFDRLGIAGYGFSPLRLPADLDFTALFHGVDERVPVDALTFGTRVLAHFLLHC